MILRFGCWPVLLVVCCVALAGVEVSTDEIELDNNTFVDNVPFQSDCDCGLFAKSCFYVEGEKKCICDDLYVDYRGTCTECDCGEHGNCSLYDYGKVCRCEEGYKLKTSVIKKNSGKCEECDCGENGICAFNKGNKECSCKIGFADNRGICQACDCNSMYDCEFGVFGYKKCKCPKGYVQLNDKCRECNCGEHGNCTLYSFGKICRCEEGYKWKTSVINAYSGICEECDCGENGGCEFNRGYKECTCKPDFAENRGKCQACNCSPGRSCTFKSDFDKECICPPGYVNFKGRCKECDCGDNGICTFNEGNKQCDCDLGFSENYRGLCEVCDCKMDDSNCTIDGFQKKCQCPKGFKPTKDFENPECIDIDECLRPEDNDCDSLSTKCVNTKGSYYCVCKEGFEVNYKYGGEIDINRCKDIDECLDYSPCIDLHTRCINTPGSYRCECTAGYSMEKDSYAVEYCSEDNRPWKTASIVVGCLFGFVSLGLLIAICNKHCNMS